MDPFQEHQLIHFHSGGGCILQSRKLSLLSLKKLSLLGLREIIRPVILILAMATC